MKKDLENDTIVVQLRALGLLGKLLSGPWMQRFYANKDHLTNLEIIPIVKSCIQTLTALGEQLLLTLWAEMDAMGGKLDKTDTVLTSLQQPLSSEIEEERFCKVFQKLVKGTVQVLEKQLDYLSNHTADRLDQTNSASIHNIMAEQVLGLTDHQCRRSTIAFIDGKVKSRKYRTLNWLESKEHEDQERIVAFAINRARKMRKIGRKREVKIAEIQDQRLRIKQQKYDRSARSKVEKKLVCMGTTRHAYRTCLVPRRRGDLPWQSRTKEIEGQDSHDHSCILVRRGD